MVISYGKTCLSDIICFQLEKMSYGITYLTEAHAIHVVMFSKRTCLMGIDVLWKDMS